MKRKSINILMFALIVGAFLFSTINIAKAASVVVNCPDTVTEDQTASITAQTTGYNGDILHIYITDCDGTSIDKTSVPINQDSFSTTYSWNTQVNASGLCEHTVTAKVYSSSGDYIAMDTAQIEVVAAGTGSSSGGSSTPSTGGVINTRFGPVNGLPDYITKIYNTFLPYAISIVIIVIIISGYILMTSTGNPDAVSKAKGYIIDALVGLVVIVLLKLIIDTIWAPF